MPLARWWPRLIPLPGNPSVGAVDVGAQEWLAIASDVAAAGGQLLALWTTLERDSDVHATVRAALLADSRVLVPALRMPAATDSYPGLQDFFPAATRMQRAAFDLTGVPFLWVHSSDHLDINGWSVTGATHASYSVLIGGASETEIGNGSATGREVAISLGAGLISGGAGHGIYLQPSSVAQAMRDLVLEDVDVDHPMKCGLRAVTGAGGGIYNAVARGLRIDSACQNESGEVQQVVLGSDASSIVDGFVFSSLKIRKSSGIATRGLTHNAATGVINVHVLDSDIRDSGSTSNYYDVNRIVTWARTMGGLNRRVSYDTAAPGVGLYTRGDIIWNTLPSASGKAGWVCTTGGDAASTAVFKPFASIDA